MQTQGSSASQTGSATDSPKRVSVGLLLIGYGNELRGDDAAGPRIARAVADWQYPGVESLALHQLVPEIAEPIARAVRVLFVDACREVERVRWRRLRAAQDQPTALGHVSDPERLLAWAQALYGRCPPAWLLAVPAHSFELGASLSLVTRNALPTALKSIRRFIQAATPVLLNESFRHAKRQKANVARRLSEFRQVGC